MDNRPAPAHATPPLPAYDCSAHTPPAHSLDRKASQDALGALPTYHDSQRLRSAGGRKSASASGRRSFSFESNYGIPLPDTQREHIWGSTSSSASSPRSLRSEGSVGHASSDASHRSDATSNTSCHSFASAQLNKRLSLPVVAEKRPPLAPSAGSSTSIRFSTVEPHHPRASSSQSHRNSALEPQLRYSHEATLRSTEVRPRRAASVRMSGLGLPRGPITLELCEATDGSGSLSFRFQTSDHGVLLQARVPSMKAGYKAVLSTPLFGDAGSEALYEVRREPLAKRYDFRLPTGEHTVLSRESAKLHALEAHDGQRLAWRQEASGNLSLVSLPSGYVLAMYRLYTGPAQVRGGSFSAAPDALRGALQVMPISAGSQDGGRPVRRSPSTGGSVHRTISATPSASSTLSTAPRLGPAFRTLAVGLVLPGLASAALVAPHASVESTRRSETLGDELTNLGFGRLSMGAARPARRAEAELEEDRVAALGVELDEERKSSDPRPRAVPLPLIAASLIAVLAARGQA